MGIGQSSSSSKEDGFCCQGQTLRPKPKPKPKPGSRQRSPTASQTDVSLRITGHVAAKEGKDTNLVFSPLLLQVVLSLIASGSRGPTRQQILSFLGSDSVDDLNRAASELVQVALADGSANGGPKLCFVNGVWVDQSVGFKQAFKHLVEHTYKAASQQVDFQSKAVEVANKVNSWVERNTNSLIKELIPHGSIDSATRLILANALYFKGTWKHKFDSSKTHDSKFHLLNGGSITTPFMTSRGSHFVRAYNGFKVLRLCYEQGNDNKRQLSMYIFLPDAKNGLPSLLKKATSSEPDFLDQHRPQFQVQVGNFMVPRFKFSFGFEASKTLKEMGLAMLFSSPDLREMVDSENMGKNNLCVSKVFHKAFIEVNEEGTEAAAATAATIMFKSAVIDDDRVDFVADHPFMFFIRDDLTGVVLFVGHVMNPNSTC